MGVQNGSIRGSSRGFQIEGSTFCTDPINSIFNRRCPRRRSRGSVNLCNVFSAAHANLHSTKITTFKLKHCMQVLPQQVQVEYVCGYFYSEMTCIYESLQ